MKQLAQRIQTPVVSPTTGELIIPPIEPGSLPGAFGHPYSESGQETIHATTKALASKIAWVLGTTYGIPYSGKRTAVYPYATKIVTAILRDHGYPI